MPAIARHLGRPVSTISREIQRNGSSAYDATQAARSYAQCRQHCVRRRVLAQDTALYQYVHDRLVYSRWSCDGTPLGNSKKLRSQVSRSLANASIPT